MATPVRYQFRRLRTRRDPTYVVRVTYIDGRIERVGTVCDFFIRHMNRRGWEATDQQGAHRAVHDHRWQAALALTWDATTVNPFPFPASRRREVERR